MTSIEINKLPIKIHKQRRENRENCTRIIEDIIDKIIENPNAKMNYLEPEEDSNENLNEAEKNKWINPKRKMTNME